MTTENQSRKTSPSELASLGMISVLKSSAWFGDIPFPINKEIKKRGLIPNPYFDSIKSLQAQRHHLFSYVGVDTVFGKYLTFEAINRWTKVDSKLCGDLTSIYETMSKDRKSLIDNAKAVGRIQAEHEWNRINPGSEAPSTLFYVDFENKFSSLIPDLTLTNSYLFWTNYYNPPPHNSSKQTRMAYGNDFVRLSGIFSRQVILGLKQRVIEASDYVNGMVKKSGGMDPRISTRLPKMMENIQDMHLFKDEKTNSLIKDLKDISPVWYKDGNKAVNLANELRMETENLLDRLIIEEDKYE